MLKSYLIENYGYNEPIFLNELKILRRMVAGGYHVN